MMMFFSHIPYMEPYGNPIYFVYLILAFLPVIIGIFKQKRLSTYETLVSLVFILFMFGGDHYQQLVAFLFIFCGKSSVFLLTRNTVRMLIVQECFT